MNRDEIIKWVRDNTRLMYEPNFTEGDLEHIAMCLEHLLRWYHEGGQIGSFVTAIAKNDFRKACLYADDVNQKAVYLYALFVSNHLNSDYITKAQTLKYT